MKMIDNICYKITMVSSDWMIDHPKLATGVIVGVMVFLGIVLLTMGTDTKPLND